MRNSNINKSAATEFGAESTTYDKNYDLAHDRYPDHVFRLKIFLDLLAALKPKQLLDAGCGSGVPLINFLDADYNTYGFDLSPNMVQEAKQNVKAAGHDDSRVFQGDLDNFSPPTSEKFDAIAALGSVYYTPDTLATLGNLKSHLTNNGDLIFSLRNELFSLFSLNKYSVEYLTERIYPIRELSTELRNSVEEFLSSKFTDADIAQLFKNVDERQIMSQLHNPLTVATELLDPIGMELVDIYYYHFHALPPIFEHTHPQEFRKLSAACESPSDWRGLFMASCFVVHARPKN